MGRPIYPISKGIKAKLFDINCDFIGAQLLLLLTVIIIHLSITYLFKFKKPNIFIIIDIWHDDFWNFTQFLRQLAATAAVACDVTGRQLFFKTAGLQLRVYFDSGKQKTADHSTSWKMMSNVLLIYGHS
jgi:hypothetical protein